LKDRKEIWQPGSLVFRWALAGVPELQLFQDDDQREAAITELEKQGSVLQGIGHGIVLLVVLLLFKEFIWFRIPAPQWAEWGISPFIPPSVMIAYSTFLQRRRASKFFRDRLLKSGVPICIQCGYCLRGIESNKCPECGREIEANIRRMIEEDATRVSGKETDVP